jgi:molybdate transport system substrate-binding protein
MATQRIDNWRPSVRTNPATGAGADRHNSASKGNIGRRLVLVVAAVLLAATGCKRTQGTLVVHVGGTMRPAIEELAKAYEQQTGQKIEINATGSGQLLAFIESHQSGDLYICHDPFMDILMQRKLGKDAWMVAELTPVIVVQKGNPRKIANLRDATAPGVALVLTDFDQSTLGRMLPKIFEKAGIDLGPVRQRVSTFREGGQAATKVALKNADAAIVWNAVAYLRRDSLDVVPIAPEHLPAPGADTITSATGKAYTLTPARVTVATLKCSKLPQAARAFAEYLASEKATEVFKKYQFTPCQPRMEYRDGLKLP